MSSDEQQSRTPANAPWIWCGIHGASTDIEHPFFAIRDDLERRYAGIGDHPLGNYGNGTILASSGGLILISPSPFDVDNYEPPELEPLDEEENEDVHRLGYLLSSVRLHDADAADQTDSTSEADQAQSSLELEQHWHALRLINPDSEDFLSLPPANSKDVGLDYWSYDGVQPNLLVDPESQTYTVTLTFPDFVCLYSSTSLAWRCRRFNQGDSWGPHNKQLFANPWESPWEMQVTSAYVDGRLFFADVVVEDSIPFMNLIEIDAEAGSWKLHNWRYSLQTEFTEFQDTPFLRMRGLTDRDRGIHQALNTRPVASRRRSGTGRALENFQIVECMGELYAVIPMGLSEYLPMNLRSRRTLTEVVDEYANFELCFMPLQFMIVRMRGDGFVHGVLRILAPKDLHSAVGAEAVVGNTEHRKLQLMEMMERSVDPEDKIGWRFSCVGEGSVIWVSLLDYVLQYDVVTGVSKTEIIEQYSELKIWVHGVPYRPSAMMANMTDYGFLDELDDRFYTMEHALRWRSVV